ncbi:peptidoglycan DD-metalloendopeptidase family protein [Aneurinibacillus aneurinilyticus]|nr:M23 family metallopeptidase [Aneurinibacillus aneurinilyticus]MED0730398.1 M23 family metallopeptidase [Aneurinibacillus aneurinilyticus]MED0739227.1 M23 family metallopeptidase [Aneurinibacillus aneurinilyticus]
MKKVKMALACLSLSLAFAGPAAAEENSHNPVQSLNVSKGYGWYQHPNGYMKFHQGIDVPGKLGEPIYAYASGKVVFASEVPGYGTLIKIEHQNGVETWYGHAKGLLVQIGKEVRAGEHIADMGTKGTSTGPHLHFEVRVNGKSVDPGPYISQGKASEEQISDLQLEHSIKELKNIIDEPSTKEAVIAPFILQEKRSLDSVREEARKNAEWAKMQAKPAIEGPLSNVRIQTLEYRPPEGEMELLELAGYRYPVNFNDKNYTFNLLNSLKIMSYLPIYKEAGAEFDIPWTYIAAIHGAETRFGQLKNKENQTEHFNFTPEAWRVYGMGGDPGNVQDGARACAFFLKEHGFLKDKDKALLAYHHSETYVKTIHDLASRLSSK